MDDFSIDETLRLERLREIFDDDREAIVDVLRECSRYVRGGVEELRRAREAGDATGVRRAAHGIKGSCSNVGAIACERAAKAIESAARDGNVPADLEPLRILVDGLDAAIARYAASDASA